MNAFFIVGVQRSGTTLLSVMLGKHPEILMEQKAIGFRILTCFKNLYDLMPLNLQHDKKAFLAWLIKNDVNGRLMGLIDLENIKQYDTIRDLLQGSIKKKLSESDKKIWGDKSPNMQHYLSDLLMMMPMAKILHIVRDGRANAYSMSTRSYQHLSLSAQKWVDGNVFGLVNQEFIGAQQYKIIHYENLLRDPEKEARAICEFLEIPFLKEMLNLSDDQLGRPESYVKNFFDDSKIDKWKTQLNTKEIKRIEKIQGPLLSKMGYDLMTPLEQLDHQPLSLRRKIGYNQLDNLKQIFRRKRIGMRDNEMVELDTTIKSRAYSFLRFLARDILSLPIFKSLFSRFFYKEKFYQPKKKDRIQNKMKL